MVDAHEPRKTRVTLAQVAERARVSLKTASRALGGESYVSEETRDRVLAAAQELDYQRNAAASLLASGRLAESIGLITGDFNNPFYATVAQAIEDEIRPHEIHLSVANSQESPEREQLLASDLATRQMKALIVVSAMASHTGYSSLQARGTPVVFVDRQARDLDADSVVFDNVEGGRLLARHLREAGHRRIAVVGDYRWLPTHQERLAGMASVLDDGAADWRSLVRSDVHSVAEAREHAERLLLLDRPPTAIVAGNNRILLGVAKAVSALDPVVRPSVIGFDDVEWADVMGISVVSGDVAALGREAARLALHRLDDRGGPIESSVLPMRLIPRASTARPLP